MKAAERRDESLTLVQVPHSDHLDFHSRLYWRRFESRKHTHRSLCDITKSQMSSIYKKANFYVFFSVAEEEFFSFKKMENFIDLKMGKIA